MIRKAIRAWACVLLAGSIVVAQQAASSKAGGDAVPPMVNFSGILTDANAKPLTGLVGVTFSLYGNAQDGVPLWVETQNVQADKAGHYTAMLGAASSQGLPVGLFASGEARWLAVQAQGQPEQARVLLLSVPYALKAGDAQTVGGLPPSAFMLVTPGAASAISSSNAGSSSSGSPAIGGGGTKNYIPIWTDSTGDLGNSVMFQTGSGATARIGIGLTNPLTTLDVNGNGLMRGLFEMATMGFATPTKGFNSQPFNLESSSYNSGTAKYTLQHFQWQAEAIGNNTSNPSATLNLLFGIDPAAPTETGLKINNKGVFTFAPGQTFPGTGDITGVTAGTDLTGGGTSGTVTLNLDTTKVPQLATSNTFAATQHITGDLDVTGNVNATASVTGALGVFNGNGTEGVYGQTTGSVGVLGVSDVNRAVEGDDYANGGLAVFGDELGTSGSTIGVLGQTFSPSSIAVEGANFGGGGFGVYGYTDRSDSTFANAAGVLGVDVSGSSLGAGLEFASGVWGDTSDNIAVGMLATADAGNAMAVFNNSTTNSTMYITNFEESSPGAFILDISSFYGGFCNFLANGTLSCSGGLTTVVPTDSAKNVQVYSVQSPENWFEDFGSSQLSGGSAIVRLEPGFAQTVNTATDYHVFLTPKGECNGLYVTNENAGGFEVRELGHGKSAVAFDYRIVAHRKGYENLRLADATEISKRPMIRRTNQPQTLTRPVPQAPAGRRTPHTIAPITRTK